MSDSTGCGVSDSGDGAREAARYDEPVLRQNKWLEDHSPGGTIGYPWPGEPQMQAAVNDTVIAFTARDDLGELMDRVDEAEAGGCCPLHPAVAP